MPQLFALKTWPNIQALNKRRCFVWFVCLKHWGNGVNPKSPHGILLVGVEAQTKRFCYLASRQDPLDIYCNLYVFFLFRFILKVWIWFNSCCTWKMMMLDVTRLSHYIPSTQKQLVPLCQAILKRKVRTVLQPYHTSKRTPTYPWSIPQESPHPQMEGIPS